MNLHQKPSYRKHQFLRLKKQDKGQMCFLQEFTYYKYVIIIGGLLGHINFFCLMLLVYYNLRRTSKLCIFHELWKTRLHDIYNCRSKFINTDTKNIILWDEGDKSQAYTSFWCFRHT